MYTQKRARTILVSVIGKGFLYKMFNKRSYLNVNSKSHEREPAQNVTMMWKSLRLPHTLQIFSYKNNEYKIPPTALNL